jgi:elongation factor G
MIVAAMGLKNATTGDTLCTSSAPIVFVRIDAYEPVISMAIEPDTNADKERLDFGLQKLVDEDPTFRVHEDPETGQTIIRGMGELHLEVIVDRLVREYGVKARAGKPQVVFRETIAKTAEADGKFERLLEDEAIYGKVRVRVAPRPRHSGMAYVQKLPEFPPVPPNIAAAAMAGVREASQSGPAGYPMEDVEVTVLSVETREGASPETGTKIAASNAFRAACAEAGPRVLEPIMAVEVVVPEDFLGPAIGDLNQRRGRIEDVGSRGEKRVIAAKVPLQRMFGYSTVLRSLSQGRAVYTMQFAEYDAWE